MEISFVLGKEELLKALKELEIAESKGFMHCQAIFNLTYLGFSIGDTKVNFDELLVKGHPKNGKKNWGRSKMYNHFSLVRGKLKKDEL